MWTTIYNWSTTHVFVLFILDLVSFWLLYLSVRHFFKVISNIEDYLLDHSEVFLHLWRIIIVALSLVTIFIFIDLLIVLWNIK